MEMSLRLTHTVQDALRDRAVAEDITMQEAALPAVREFVARGHHMERVHNAASLIIDRHADALRRLGK